MMSTIMIIIILVLICRSWLLVFAAEFDAWSSYILCIIIVSTWRSWLVVCRFSCSMQRLMPETLTCYIPSQHYILFMCCSLYPFLTFSLSPFLPFSFSPFLSFALSLFIPAFLSFFALSICLSLSLVHSLSLFSLSLSFSPTLFNCCFRSTWHTSLYLFLLTSFPLLSYDSMLTLMNRNYTIV